MRSIGIIIVILLANLICGAQAKFLPGYFVNNNGEKVVCEILNSDWKYYPKSITYRINTTDDQKSIKGSDLAEFYIENGPTYKRITVKMDRSSDDPAELSTNADPEFNEESLLLKVLVEGKASLFMFEDKNLVRYFIKMDSLPIEQLIKKSYKVGSSSINTNNSFRQQLTIYLDCKNVNKDIFEFINYYEYELTKVFVKYNECVNQIPKIKVKKAIKLSLNIRPGLSNQSFKLASQQFKSINVDFGSSSNFRIGAELEIFLPFNNKSWSVIVEPTYRYFKGSGTAIKATTAGPTVTQKVTCDYSAIEFPIGLRYNFNINDKISLFINAVYHFEKGLQSSVVYDDGTKLNITFRSKPNFGFGVSVLKKFSAEVRFRGNTKLGEYNYIEANYKHVALILGYRIF